MNILQIEKLLYVLGCKDTMQNGSWVRCACPLAPFLHKKGYDSHPSFGVESVIGGARFHCFTCQSGSIEELVMALEMYVKAQPEMAPKYDFEAARLILQDKDLNVHLLPDFESNDFDKQFQEWPQWYLETFPLALHSMRAAVYLKTPKPLGRGLSEEEIVKWGFRYDPNRDMVVIPFYDAYGHFAGIRGRSIEGRWFHDYTWNEVNNTSLVWLNEVCFQNYEPVVVVEGQFDTVAVERHYENVVGNLTAKLTTGKLNKLKGCPAAIFMMDNDDTGSAATKKAIEYLEKEKLLIGVATYPHHDPDDAGGEAIREALIPFVGIDKLKQTH